MVLCSKILLTAETSIKGRVPVLNRKAIGIGLRLRRRFLDRLDEEVHVAVAGFIQVQACVLQFQHTPLGEFWPRLGQRAADVMDPPRLALLVGREDELGYVGLVEVYEMKDAFGQGAEAERHAVGKAVATGKKK